MHYIIIGMVEDHTILWSVNVLLLVDVIIYSLMIEVNVDVVGSMIKVGEFGSRFQRSCLVATMF